MDGSKIKYIVLRESEYVDIGGWIDVVKIYASSVMIISFFFSEVVSKVNSNNGGEDVGGLRSKGNT